jgi:alkylation response protein AidB-like acyl-CoA dehydrogenase
VLSYGLPSLSEVTVQFNLTDEQLMLTELMARVASERYAPGRRAEYRAATTGFSAESWAQLAELGVFAAPFLPEHGGLGGTLVDIMVLMEAVGRGLIPEPVLEQVIAPGRLMARASADVRERWLPRIIAGEAHLALAHFEETAGFELSRVQVIARDGIVLNGEKAVVFGAGGAEAFIVSAQDEQGIGMYLIARDAPGLTLTPFRVVDGSVACKLTLREVRGESLRIGFESFADAVDDIRIAASAEMLGIMSALFEATVEYVRTRKQFGAPLGSFQVIQHRLAELYVLLEQSRSQLYRAALSPSAMAIAGMKSYLSAAAVQMGEQCIHLHGGMGTTDELPIGHRHKRLLVLATLFGDADSELQRFIALQRAPSAASVAA